MLGVNELVAFVGVAALVIVTPGQDTALTIRNTLAGGRAAGIATAVGVASAQALWTLAATSGVTGLLVASEPVFHALKLAGAVYLGYLGAQALLRAVRAMPEASGRTGAGGLGPTRLRLAAYRQGLLSNLGNPKMAIFFASLLPQFVPVRDGAFVDLAAHGALFCAMTLAWLAGYAVVVARAGDVLRGSGIRRLVDAVTGAVLVGLGLRLAAEPS
jgi:threonine/homoserine/homoserine lactone efflux protein